MRKIINGKTYNTEAAAVLAEWSKGYASDMAYFNESIHRTKNGNLFLYQDGGPLSSMSVDIGNNSTAGSHDIRALDEQECYEILAAWHDANKIDADEMLYACKIIGIAEPLEA